MSSGDLHLAPEHARVVQKRIFLACSAELSEERQGFAACIERIGTLDHVARNFELVPVMWETEAFGGSAEGIDSAIRDSTEFERTSVVIVVIWNRAGEGTLAEWRRALEMWRTRRSPRILVFTRTPRQDADPRPNEQFRREVIDAGFVPNQYDDPETFFDRLTRQLPLELLSPAPVLQPPTSLLRSRYIRAGACSVLLAAASWALARVVSYPDKYVNVGTILALLAMPVMLAASFAWAAVALARLLDRFRVAWHSPDYLSVPLARDFRGVLPVAFLPRYLRARIPTRKLDEFMAVLVLAVVLLAPPIAQLVCVVGEIMSQWRVAVSWDQGPLGADGIPTSPYVEGGWRTWLFGLQNSESRERLSRDTDSIVYVHAHGRFGTEASARSNLGPQVWVPAQAWIYLSMVAGELVASVWISRRIWLIARS